MSRSTNAVLLSALVLPGAGQLYLKHFKRGIALIGVSLASLWVLLDKVMQMASTVLDQMQSEGGAIDAGQITEWVAQATNSPGSALAMAASWVLAACWLIGVIDAYRLGRVEDPDAA